MLGTDVSRIFDSKKLYKGFLNNTRKNDILKEALVLEIESTYDELIKQDNFDDIDSAIKTDKVFAVNNNFVYVLPIPITTISIGSPAVVTTTIPHNIITGDLVYLTGVLGTINTINGAFYTATVTSSTTFSVPFNSTGLVYTSGSGHISQHQDLNSVPKLIPDYNHLLTVKFKYNQVIPNVRIVDATNTQPVVITLNTRNNNIKTGEQITNFGIFGNPNANGTFYVKKLGSLKYQLFRDRDLTISVSGNGNYTGGGNIVRPVYHYATPMFSYKKISDYDKPDIFKPKFERAENSIKALPNDSVCQELTCDYISSSLVYIDCTNAAIDLENYYPNDFLYQVIDRAVVLFAERFKDTELLSGALMEEQKAKE